MAAFPPDGEIHVSRRADTYRAWFYWQGRKHTTDLHLDRNGALAAARTLLKHVQRGRG